jgi:hypothetical protein
MESGGAHGTENEDSRILWCVSVQSGTELSAFQKKPAACMPRVEE